MPKVIKKKPAKKKPVQEDEVKSAAFHALEKMKKRQKQIIIGLSVVVALAVLYMAFALYSSYVANEAYTLEREAYRYYYGQDIAETMSDEERWKKALELYKKAVEVKVSPTALYYVGNCYYNLKQYDKAIEAYNEFTDKFSSDKGILPLVYQKLASAYFKTNQNKKALEILGKLALVENGIFKDTALILEARYYERVGEKEKALEKYKQIITEFPVSPWSAEAGSKVAAAEADQTKTSEESAVETEKKIDEQPE